MCERNHASALPHSHCAPYIITCSHPVYTSFVHPGRLLGIVTSPCSYSVYTSFVHHTIANILPYSQIFVPRLRTNLVLHVHIRTPRHALPHPSRWFTSHIGVIEIGQPAQKYGLAVLFMHKFLLGKVGRNDSLPYTKTYAMNECEAKEELLDS